MPTPSPIISATMVAISGTETQSERMVMVLVPIRMAIRATPIGKLIATSEPKAMLQDDHGDDQRDRLAAGLAAGVGVPDPAVELHLEPGVPGGGGGVGRLVEDRLGHARLLEADHGVGGASVLAQRGCLLGEGVVHDEDLVHLGQLRHGLSIAARAVGLSRPSSEWKYTLEVKSVSEGKRVLDGVGGPLGLRPGEAERLIGLAAHGARQHEGRDSDRQPRGDHPPVMPRRGAADTEEQVGHGDRLSVWWSEWSGDLDGAHAGGRGAFGDVRREELERFLDRRGLDLPPDLVPAAHAGGDSRPVPERARVTPEGGEYDAALRGLVAVMEEELGHPSSVLFVAAP